MKILITRGQWEMIGKTAGWSSSEFPMYKFIHENRDVLDELIQSICPDKVISSDKDRIDLILSNHELYNWARSRGANI